MGRQQRYHIFEFTALRDVTGGRYLNGDTYESFFKNIVENDIHVPIGRSDYFVSHGDFSIQETGELKYISGKIGRIRSKVTQQTYDDSTKQFKTTEVKFDDQEGALFAEFIFFYEINRFCVRDRNDVLTENIQKFINHVVEMILGQNTIILSPLFMKDIQSILDTGSIKDISLILKKPNPIDPEKISVIKKIFKGTHSDKIVLKFSSELYALKPVEEELIQHSLNLANYGYGMYKVKYIDENGAGRLFDSKKDILSITTDKIGDTLEEIIEWFLENISQLNV